MAVSLRSCRSLSNARVSTTLKTTTGKKRLGLLFDHHPNHVKVMANVGQVFQS